jgi:arsenate reductase (thioredoxin)
MKILFICEWNVGRSQMGEELFNHYTKNNIGISAGTHAEKYAGKKLKEFAYLVVDVLKEKGIDVSNKTPIQLTEEMAQFADTIIVMTEQENLPSYLLNSNKVISWDIKDAGGKDYAFHINMRDQIDLLVKELVDRIG